MFDFSKKSMPDDAAWFAKRYRSLIVVFPEAISADVLRNDDVCSPFDPAEAYDALKSAHEFLRSVAEEMHRLSDESERIAVIERTFLKLDLIWGVACYGDILRDGDGYYISFDKSNLKNRKQLSLPKNFAAAFDAITESGCRVRYFKDEREVGDYRTCTDGHLHFPDNLTALGVFLFVKKCTQKRWYWDFDRAGSYTSDDSFDPVIHSIEPYNRIDMRVFTCGDRLKFDIYEQLAGYGDELVGYFKTIYEFVRDNYPECMPVQGFYNYVCCSVNFMADLKHAMLGALGVGHSENAIGFYGAMSGEVKAAAAAEFGADLRGERFPISCESDVEYVIKFMKTKARHGKNVLPKKK
jgi:hypothetical protein